jgi:hypothetical protein
LIWDELMKELSHHGLNLGISNSSKVTVDWLLAVLSTLKPSHEFFNPGFYPEEARSSFKMGNVNAAFVDEIPGYRFKAKNA